MKWIHDASAIGPTNPELGSPQSASDGQAGRGAPSEIASVIASSKLSKCGEQARDVKECQYAFWLTRIGVPLPLGPGSVRTRPIVSHRYYVP
ncbi:hypothetical protein GCM10027614_20490 [Micromonospora vulcania]